LIALIGLIAGIILTILALVPPHAGGKP